MSDEEDYDSSEDEDYVPSDGEAVSEEENSGEEENLDALIEDGEPVRTGKRKRKPAKQKLSSSRKRVGGIKLENETVVVETEEDDGSKQLEEQIKLEQEKKKEEQQKKRADDLWSSFMSDVGKRPEKKPVASSGLGSFSSSINKSSPTKAPVSETKTCAEKPSVSVSDQKSTITVTKVYDFAGEAVKVTKEIDVNSKEGKAELKKQQEETDIKPGTEDVPAKTAAVGGVKRPGGGLGGVLAKINKKPKMGTLEKSKLDWEEFKEKEGINEELKIHNRGKQSYIERMNFLQRTDQRQFELEKNVRLSSSSKR